MNKLWIPLFLTACGSSGGGSTLTPGGTDKGNQAGPYTMAIASEADLPPCTEANAAQLVWIKSTNVFKSCEAGSWVEVDIPGKAGDTGPAGPAGATGAAGTSGVSGIGIASHKRLAADATNFCLLYGDPCQFEGGYMITYTDGAVQVQANWYHFRGDTTNTGNILHGGAGLLIKPAEVSGSIKLDTRVSRGAAFHQVLVSYLRSDGSIKLYYDLDDSGTVTAGDELLLNVTQE